MNNEEEPCCGFHTRWRLCAQLRRPLIIRCLRAFQMGLGPARYGGEIVCVGTARLLRANLRRVDSHTDADYLRATLSRRRSLLALTLSPRGHRSNAPSYLHRIQTQMNNAATPNHALQRTAPGVTACAPAASLRSPPATFPHRLRRPPPSLSLGSLGVATRL